jgi:hypothetical protein
VGGDTGDGMQPDMSNQTGSTCPVRIRVWDKDDGMFDCRLAADHPGEHEGTGLYAYQTISWLGDDRHSFTGEYARCSETLLSACEP